MVDAGAVKPRVFLSSVFKEEIDDEWKDLSLRQRIIEDHQGLPIHLWAYELFWPKGSETPSPDADTIVDRCFASIRNCDLFVFLLTRHHGSGAEFVKHRVLASYLELELFAAAMLQKPVLVLHQRGHEPEPALRDSLGLLHQTFASDRYVVDDENGLYDQFRAECDRLAAGDGTSTGPILAHLPDWLSRRRSRKGFGDELADPSLRFLDGNFRSSRSAADPAKAKLLLDQVATGMRGDATRQQLMPHGAALFRLWAAMRELMDDAESTLADPSLAPLWDQAFGLWGSNASWFGLHGHLWMGPLASVQSQIELRRKFAAEPSFHEATDVREPLGARASALYSIAGRTHSRLRKLRHYRLAAALATQAIERDQDAHQGVLLIRGHTSMQIAKLGQFWKMWDADTDFRLALELREKSGVSAASVGEAKVDLGQCLVLTGRWPAGLALMREGVTLMRSDDSANGMAFLARGLRKLEQGARIAGRVDIANEAREERMRLATEVEAMDQIREP